MNFLPFAKAFLLVFFLAYSLKAERVRQKILADTIESPDRIYITLDKPYYSVTETIFFKVYQLNAQNFKPHDFSRVVYVNLLNENNQTIFSKKVKIEEGCSSGEIYLPDSLKGGVYKIVGFNNWMRNFDKAFIFQKELTVLNFFDKVPFTSQRKEILSDSLVSKLIENRINFNKAPELDVQFFPESGHLVNNVNSKVAVKAIDRSGRGIELSGKIVDDNGNEITEFETNPMGMGYFFLNPLPSLSYKAQVLLADSSLKEMDLPKSMVQGIVLSADNSGANEVNIKIMRKGQGESLPSKGILEVSVRGKKFLNQKIYFSSGLKELNIAKDIFPTGIAQIRLTDDTGLPLCERLIFINNGQYLQITPKIERNIYSPREQVNLEFEAKDLQGNPVAANFSMRVVDANQISSTETVDNIVTNLFITSELSGAIENPGFYTLGKEQKIKENIDLLLLTNGWKKYVWNKLNNKGAEGFQFFRESNLRLSGRVLDSKGNAAKYATVVINYPGESTSFLYTSTNEAGEFNIPIKHSSSKNIILTAIGTSSKEEEMSIVLGNNSYRIDSLTENGVFNPSSFNHYFKTRNLILRINEEYKISDTLAVSVPDTTKREAHDFELSDNQTTKADDYVSFSTMKELIQEIVPGFKFKKENGGLEVRLLNENTKMFFKAEPLYFIDFVQVPNLQYILEMDPFSVDEIILIKDPDDLKDFGPLALDGIFAVTTKEKNYVPKNLKNSLYLNYSGFEIKKEVYSPMYKLKTDEQKVPAFPSILYWNPTVVTDSNGKAKVSFYNSDAVGPFKVYIEGISSDGLPGVNSITYEVNLSN